MSKILAGALSLKSVTQARVGLSVLLALSPALGAICSPPAPQAPPLPQSVAELVERFERRESIHQALSAHLENATTFRVFLRDLERQEARVQPQILAIFALDAAGLVFREMPMAEARKGMHDALAILEVGCAALRKASRTPSEFEIRWHALAADLITGTTRRKSGSAETMWLHAYLSYDNHFKHLQARSNKEPLLALSFARYQQAQYYVWRFTSGVIVTGREGVPSRRHEAVRRLETVVEVLKPLLGHPDFSDEARVRTAAALVQIGRVSEGLALLSDRPIADAELDYVRRLMLADAFIDKGNTLDAAREYEAAILRVPDARPANIALAGLAYLAGQHDRALSLVTRDEQWTTPDPWIAFMYPGAGDWDARLAALREAARGK